MNDAALIAAVTARSELVHAQASNWYREHKVAPPQPELRFDLTGASAGQLRWQTGARPVIRYNLAIAAAQPEAFIHETVPHEIAHLVTTACFGRVRPHGPEWRAVMASFGHPHASRCHAFQVPAGPARRQRRWPYRCDCREHELSTTRHNRTQSGRAHYLCRHCGSALRNVTASRS